MWMWIWMSLAAAMPIGDLNWVVVNDTVMGGVSRSSVRAGDALVFTGDLSLERNGGFASIRARTPEGSFDGASALRVELRGDGRTYDLTLRRSDVPLRAGSYRVRIPTSPDPTVVEVPLSAFRPTSFGRSVPGAPALDAGLQQIDTVGLMLADKQAGPFEVEILSLAVVRDERASKSSRHPAIERLSTAIQAGVAKFNAGDHQGCAETYRTALTDVLETGLLTPGEMALVDDALLRSTPQVPMDAAWTLRHAMDSVLYTGI